MKTILRNWPAFGCILFLLAAIYFAGDRLGEFLIAFGIPIVFAFIFIGYLIFDKGDESDEQDNLLTKFQIFWMKLTMPKKKTPKDK